MVYLGGGDLVEVGYANEGKEEHIESAINQNTAAILFVKSHHAVQKIWHQLKKYMKLHKEIIFH